MIILMSGEIATGKTTVAEQLEDKHGFKRIRSGTYLAEVAKDRGLETNRYGLQKMGDILDRETHGSWIAKLAQYQISKSEHVKYWVLDSARRDFQVSRFREIFKEDVVHIHLLAADNILSTRFHARAADDGRDSGADYDRVKGSETEQHAKDLGAIADISANSAAFTPDELAQLIELTAKVRSVRGTI